VAFNDFKDGVSFSGLSATPANFYLLGGRYAFSVSATFGGGSVTLNQLQNDGSTLIPAAVAITAAGSEVVDLPPGTYQVTIVTATAVVGAVVRVPFRAA
jgi:hypothetical protein